MSTKEKEKITKTVFQVLAVAALVVVVVAVAAVLQDSSPGNFTGLFDGVGSGNHHHHHHCITRHHCSSSSINFYYTPDVMYSRSWAPRRRPAAPPPSTQVGSRGSDGGDTIVIYQYEHSKFNKADDFISYFFENVKMYLWNGGFVRVPSEVVSSTKAQPLDHRPQEVRLPPLGRTCFTISVPDSAIGAPDRFKVQIRVHGEGALRVYLRYGSAGSSGVQARHFGNFIYSAETVDQPDLPNTLRSGVWFVVVKNDKLVRSITFQVSGGLVSAAEAETEARQGGSATIMEGDAEWELVESMPTAMPVIAHSGGSRTGALTALCQPGQSSAMKTQEDRWGMPHESLTQSTDLSALDDKRLTLELQARGVDGSDYERTIQEGILFQLLPPLVTSTSDPSSRVVQFERQSLMQDLGLEIEVEQDESGIGCVARVSSIDPNGFVALAGAAGNEMRVGDYINNFNGSDARAIHSKHLLALIEEATHLVFHVASTPLPPVVRHKVADAPPPGSAAADAIRAAEVPPCYDEAVGGDNAGTTDMPAHPPPLSESASAPPPLEFCCPISHEVFIDPVLAADSFTYERAAIEAWFEKSQTSPMTGLEVPHVHLVPNLSLAAIIQAWKDSEGRS